jgi:hypothetical protein
MKQLVLSFLCVFLLSSNTFADNNRLTSKSAERKSAVTVGTIDPQPIQTGLEKFHELTPAADKKATGKRLGLKKFLALKVVQAKMKREMKKNHSASPGDGITKEIYVLFAILALGWLAIGLLSDWEGIDWIINLVLLVGMGALGSILGIGIFFGIGWLASLIHALLKMPDYVSN